MHRPELDGTKQKGVEYAGNYSIVQGLGSVNPYSYPCRHVRASDLWCRRRRDVILRTFAGHLHRQFLPCKHAHQVAFAACMNSLHSGRHHCGLVRM